MNLYILIVGIIILFLFAILISNKDILSPSCVMCGVFLFSATIALFNTNNWHIDYSLKTTGYLLAGIGCFCMMEAVVSLLIRRPKTSEKVILDYQTIEINKRKLIFIVIVELLGIFLYYMEIRAIVGTSANVLLAYRRLQTAGRSIDTSMNIFVVMLNRLLRATAYVSLYFFVRNVVIDWRGWKRQKELLLISLYLLVGCYFNSSRGEIIKIITFVIVIVYVSLMQRRAWNVNISWKFIRIGVMVFAVFLPAFYGIATLINRKPKEGLWAYISAYAGGAIHLFDLFLDSTSKYGDTNEVFGGIQSLLLRLGLIRQTTSTHLEFRWLNQTTNGNIYTFFRSPLNDFGFAGMLVFTCVVSAVFSISYYKNIKGKKRIKDMTLIYYAYLFSWISMSSIAQMANAYINIGTIIEMFFMYIIYIFFKQVKFV